jgi:hypothetical protein
MKRHAYASLFYVSFVLCFFVDNYAMVDKSQRIGWFNYEDSFDENLVDEILKCSPSIIKKYVKDLLYSDPDDYEYPDRILLLSEKNNASTLAIAKTIALRCGYDYYVIDGLHLLQAHCESKQRLLDEVQFIIEQGKPIALIITELPETVDCSGLLASTLWRLINKCTFVSDILIIGTSSLQKKQLSQQIIERFGDDIISLELDQITQQRIEKMVSKTKLIEKYKISCLVGAALICGVVATGYLFAQMVCMINFLQQYNHDKNLLQQNMIGLSGAIEFIKEQINNQNQLFQNQVCGMEQQLTEAEKKHRELQSYLASVARQKKEKKVKDDDMLDTTSAFYNNYDLDDADDGI